MRILITPEDIIKRGLWDTYVYYVAESEKKAETLLEENKEFELNERDGIIIGLLKVMETDNLIHRFNDYIIHFLQVKSIKDNGNIMIKKKSLEVAMSKFLNKFPEYWNPDKKWQDSYNDLIKYMDDLKRKIDEVEIVELSFQNVNYEFYNSNSIKKLLNFNNY